MTTGTIAWRGSIFPLWSIWELILSHILLLHFGLPISHMYFVCPNCFCFVLFLLVILTYYFYSTNKTFTLIYMHHLFFSNTWSTKVTESSGVLIQTLGPSISIWIITDGVELSMMSSIHIFFVEVVLTFKYKHRVLICKHFWYQLQWPKDNIFASN